MSRILDDFAYGNLSTTPPFNRNSELYRAMVKANDIAEKLLAKLNSEEKIMLEKFIEVNFEIVALTAIENRVHGYRLGVMMTAEAFITGQE